VKASVGGRAVFVGDGVGDTIVVAGAGLLLEPLMEPELVADGVEVGPAAVPTWSSPPPLVRK
jgi:hypothetical protein